MQILQHLNDEIVSPNIYIISSQPEVVSCGHMTVHLKPWIDHDAPAFHAEIYPWFKHMTPTQL